MKEKEKISKIKKLVQERIKLKKILENLIKNNKKYDVRKND